jgi:hypothetical protein
MFTCPRDGMLALPATLRKPWPYSISSACTTREVTIVSAATQTLTMIAAATLLELNVHHGRTVEDLLPQLAGFLRHALSLVNLRIYGNNHLFHAAPMQHRDWRDVAGQSSVAVLPIAIPAGLRWAVGTRP